MTPPFFHLTVFVATRVEDIPTGCARYLSVDGSVPGAELRWDHHVTGERINLDAMPEVVDATVFDGVGTTLADADAVASVVAVILGGKGALPLEVRRVLESASHWCDHLVPHPTLDAECNRLGRGLLDHIVERLTDGPREQVSNRFAAVCRSLVETVLTGDPLPFSDHFERQKELAERVVQGGRVTEQRGVGVLDLRGLGGIDPAALHARHSCPIALFVENHPKGGFRYTVGINPYVANHPRDLSAALSALAHAEFQMGSPCLGPAPIAGNENWGGRPTVFGSPWNYGSRLQISSVVDTLTRSVSATE